MSAFKQKYLLMERLGMMVAIAIMVAVLAFWAVSNCQRQEPSPATEATAAAADTVITVTTKKAPKKAKKKKAAAKKPAAKKPLPERNPLDEPL